jgi:lipopolysaccharide export system permease protein
MLTNTRFPYIIYKYFTKELLKYCLLALLAFVTLIFFIDIIELFRRSSNKVGVVHLIKANLTDIIGMAGLKIIGNMEKVIPFSVLIGSITCFNQWRKKNYYITSRTYGISLWRTVFPVSIIMFMIGIISIVFLNPLSSILNKKYDKLQSIYFGSSNLQSFSFDTKGFWIKETSGENQLIINAKKINEKNKMLYDINIFVVDKNKTIKERLTAVSGQFNENIINLYEVESTNRNTRTKKIEKYSLPIKFYSDDLDVTIAQPETIYILDLPKYILTMKEHGLNTSKHLLHLYKLICQPFLVIAMVLLSASLMLKSNERKMQFGIISISLVTGFSLYFIGDIVFALGSSERLPSLLSGFGPTLIGLFSGCFLVSNIDGPKKNNL